MTLRYKKKRPLTREEKTYRDDRLFIIATEDTYAPDQYFQLFSNPRIKVRVLETRSGESSPGHVIDRLDEFVAEYSLDEHDERWLMLDTDHWTEPNHVNTFRQVCSDARKKGYQLAHSNPCFEVWLLLHHRDIGEAEVFARCSEVEERLREALGAYSKRRLDLQRFPPGAVRNALERAARLDTHPRSRWPQRTGTHVYKLVTKLLRHRKE